MIEKRWQPISDEMWWAPSSCSTSLVAAKIGRSGQPVQKPGGRGGTVPDRSGIWADGSAFGARAASGNSAGPVLPDESADAVQHDLASIFAGHRQDILAGEESGRASLVEHGGHRLLQIGGLAFLDHQNGFFANAEVENFRVDQRIGDIEDMKRDLRVAIEISQAEALQGPDHRVVHTALQDDADVAVFRAEPFVQAVFRNEAPGRGQPVFDLFLFVQVGRRRQDDAVGLAPRGLQRIAYREGGAYIVLGLEGPVDMAGADADLEHHGGVRRLGQREPVLDRLDDAGVVGAGIEQPDLGFWSQRSASVPA